MTPRCLRTAGFVLLPVVLAMSLIAAIAFLLNRDNGINAEMVADQMDTDRARYAAEAGLQAVNATIQGRNCTGSYPSSVSPKTNGNLGGASYSAYASPASGNTTSLVSTGTYNGTSVTLSRSNVVAYQSASNTYTMQPNSAGGIDSWIATSSSGNNGADTELRLRSNNYPLLMMDLTAFPAGSLPLTASIALLPSQSAAGTNAVSMYRLTNSWVEGNGTTGVNWATRDGSLAWSTPGGDYHPVAAASVPDTALLVWSSFDVTDLATAWLLGRYPNQGVILASGPLAGNMKYFSSDSAFSAWRPKMTVNYLVPCGATGPSGWSVNALTLAPTADSYVDNGAAQQAYNYGRTNTLQTYTGSRTTQAMVSFDVSAIAAGTTILSAKLRFHVSGVTSPSSSTKTIAAYALTQSWLEGTRNGTAPADGVTWLTRNGTVGWTTAGGTRSATAIDIATEENSGVSPLSSGFSSGWVTWDLTPLVQQWVDGISVNNGVILVPSTVANQDKMQYDSSEAAAGVTPQLVIIY